MFDPGCCPICGYKFEECQCHMPGTVHPYRSKRQQVVNDHLYLLTPRQLQWYMGLQKKWAVEYKDPALQEVYAELKGR